MSKGIHQTRSSLTVSPRINQRPQTQGPKRYRFYGGFNLLSVKIGRKLCANNEKKKRGCNANPGHRPTSAGICDGYERGRAGHRPKHRALRQLTRERRAVRRSRCDHSDVGTNPSRGRFGRSTRFVRGRANKQTTEMDRQVGPGKPTVAAADTNNMAEPRERANPQRRRNIYLVTQELHLGLGQLFALVQLLNPLV